jgi:hypothetical protein
MRVLEIRMAWARVSLVSASSITQHGAKGWTRCAVSGPVRGQSMCILDEEQAVAERSDVTFDPYPETIVIHICCTVST